MARAIGVPRAWVFAAFSVSPLLAAVLGPSVGRAIDRRGGSGVLVASKVVLAVGLVGLSLCTGVATLVFAWAVMGVGMALGLYDAAFATLAGIYGREARGPITGITLIAGFASTVGWPLSALSDASFGWRGTCLAWAGNQRDHRSATEPAAGSLPRYKAPSRSYVGTAQGDDLARLRICRELVCHDGRASSNLARADGRNAGPGDRGRRCARAGSGGRTSRRVADYAPHPPTYIGATRCVHASPWSGCSFRPWFARGYHIRLTARSGKRPSDTSPRHRSIGSVRSRGIWSPNGTARSASASHAGGRAPPIGLLLDVMAHEVLAVSSGLCLSALAALFVLKVKPVLTPAKQTECERQR